MKSTQHIKIALWWVIHITVIARSFCAHSHFLKSEGKEYKTIHQQTVKPVFLQQREAVLPVDSIQCIMQSEIVLYSHLKINSVLEYAPAENNWRVRARNNSFLRDLFPWKSKGFLTWILKAEGHSYLLTDRWRGLATGAREDLWKSRSLLFWCCTCCWISLL